MHGYGRRCWLHEQMPSWNEYHVLCGAVACGDVMNLDAVHVSLRNALQHVVAEHHDLVVGSGRIVSDGAIPISIQDGAVHPTHQRHGLGTLIMDV